MNNDKEEMLDEYDFTGKKGVRGKYHEDFRKGHTVRVTKETEQLKNNISLPLNLIFIVIFPIRLQSTTLCAH